MIRWPFVSRARLDLALHNLGEMRELHRRDVDFYRGACNVKDKRIEVLTDRIVELRQAGADTVPPITAPQHSDVFGPLARAALSDASVGLSGPSVRAMRKKAEAIWLQCQSEPNCDEVVAIAIRRGEVTTLG